MATKTPTTLARRVVAGMGEVMELVGRNRKRSVWEGKDVTEDGSVLNSSELPCFAN